MPAEMARQLGIKGREHGIRPNSISRGLIESNPTRDRLDDLEVGERHTWQAVPGCLGVLEEIREGRTVPCRDESSYSTGASTGWSMAG